MDESKLSSLQTTLTQFHRGEYVITESAIRHDTNISEKIIQSPGDVRRALKNDIQMRSKEVASGRCDRIFDECNKQHYFDEDEFYADFITKPQRNEIHNKKRKYESSTNTNPHRLVSPPSKPSPTTASTSTSLSKDEIILRYNAILKENKILKRQYTKACKVARCLSQQLKTIHYATQQPTSQQIQNMKFKPIDDIAPE